MTLGKVENLTPDIRNQILFVIIKIFKLLYSSGQIEVILMSSKTIKNKETENNIYICKQTNMQSSSRKNKRFWNLNEIN